MRQGTPSVKGWQVTFSIRRKVAAAAGVLPITRCFNLISVVNWSAQCATMQHAAVTATAPQPLLFTPAEYNCRASRIRLHPLLKTIILDVYQVPLVSHHRIDFS